MYGGMTMLMLRGAAAAVAALILAGCGVQRHGLVVPRATSTITPAPPAPVESDQAPPDLIICTGSVTPAADTPMLESFTRNAVAKVDRTLR